jgi:hypothetical protein
MHPGKHPMQDWPHPLTYLPPHLPMRAMDFNQWNGIRRHC